MFVAMPLSGIGMPRLSIILRNRSRSSAISMESMLVPRILTQYKTAHSYCYKALRLSRALANTTRYDESLLAHNRSKRGRCSAKTLWGVPAHICAVGLYFMGCPVHSVPAQPHKTKPCSRKHQDETARKSSPQGVTIPNANAAYSTNSI